MDKVNIKFDNNRLYRFFGCNKDIFISRIDLHLQNVNNSQESSVNNSYLSEEALRYIQLRQETEKTLAEIFERKGGKISRRSPYYMTLGQRNGLAVGNWSFFGYIGFDLSEFDIDSVSFTYGDSISVINYEMNKGKEYDRNVYSYDEISEIIIKYGHPGTNEENMKVEYIEAQIWSDNPISKYRIEEDDTLEKIAIVASRLSAKIIENYHNISFNQPELFETIKIINSDPLKDWFYETVISIKEEYFDGTRTHGLKHAQKCAFYAYAMSVIANLMVSEMKLVVLAALYHDIGRKPGIDEKEHGKAGADYVGDYICDESDIDIYKIKKAISVHNIVDYVPEDLVERYVMDSDALDYMRLGLAVFDPDRIRTKEGRMLIRTAIELNYIMMLNNIPIEIVLRSEV